MMIPEVYMCYCVTSKKHNFKHIAYRWNKENKSFTDNTFIKTIEKTIRSVRTLKWRKSTERKRWKNFDVPKFMKFINNHLYWET